MDIKKVIGANLTAWMGVTPALDTIEKVEAKSGVGFGTVRRTKHGSGNITVDKLAAIARAFGRHPADLMIPCQPTASLSANGDYARTIEGNCQRIQDAAVTAPVIPLGSPLRQELNTLAEKINDNGLHELIGEARQIAKRYPRAHKGNAAQ